MAMITDDGTVEVVPLAVLTFVVGSLVLAHAWGVMAARATTAAAAREGARAFVEAPPDAALTAAESAAAARVRHPTAGRTPDGPTSTVVVSGGTGRCEPISVRVSTVVPFLSLPWIGPLGSVPVAATHQQVVDPYRAGLPGQARCAS
ncbi:MAG: hypothetical protein AAGK32_11680 [Actinomycetota bacterium]